MNMIERLRLHLRAKPFQTFDLHSAGGKVLPVAHPDFPFVSVQGRAVIFEDTSGPMIDLNPNRIAHVEASQQPAAS